MSRAPGASHTMAPATHGEIPVSTRRASGTTSTAATAHSSTGRSFRGTTWVPKTATNGANRNASSVAV